MTIHEYDIVALTEDLPATQPETQAPIFAPSRPGRHCHDGIRRRSLFG